ncbi:MAG: STAS domain-containing protein [Desulfobacterales bacterium]|nr:STAS domain-containing protein [Desulfobacterales bacterium]
MDIANEMMAGHCVVRITGRLDAVTAPELEGALGALIDDGQTRVAMDLSSLEYVSSAGLRVFLVAAKKLKAVNGEFSLAGHKDNIKEVIEISGFPSIMPCYESVDALPQA